MKLNDIDPKDIDPPGQKDQCDPCRKGGGKVKAFIRFPCRPPQCDDHLGAVESDGDPILNWYNQHRGREW